MDVNDLKQIRDIVREEVTKNNFMLTDLMDVKLNVLKNKIFEEFESKVLVWKSEIIDAVDMMASYCIASDFGIGAESWRISLDRFIKICFGIFSDFKNNSRARVLGRGEYLKT